MKSRSFLHCTKAALLVVLLGSSSLSSCRKSDQIVPFVFVDLFLNLNLPTYSNLNIIGGWVYATGGSKGLIIYRQTIESFIIYDRHCTFNVENSCGAADVASSNILIHCTCDGSTYALFDGIVTAGPATFPLKQYQNTFDNVNNTLHIFN